MGFTQKSFEIVSEIISNHEIKTVCDLGAQNDYRNEVIITNPKHYPYISEWWIAQGIKYFSIDLNGENNSAKWDLDKPLPTKMKFDLVCDFGTGEHTHDFYSCMKNIHNLAKVGGIIVRENPLTGNWPLHGYNYVDENFYLKLAEMNDYEILKLETHPAMGNTVDGWNVICIYKKNDSKEFSSSIPEYKQK